MSRAVSPSMDRTYGLARVARCWKLSRATAYRHRRPAPEPSRRPGPVGSCDDATLLEHIRKAISESRFTGEGLPQDLGAAAVLRDRQLARDA